MSATTKLYQARNAVWSNLPSAPSTFGECKRKCERGLGRGGGICIYCAQEDLADIIGDDDARAFVDAVRLVRTLEKEQDDTFGE